MEEKQYTISTIEEFVDIINPENFSNLMIDFTDLMIKITQLKKQHKKINGEYPNSAMKAFIWTDDSFRGTKELHFNDGTILKFNNLAEEDE
jgi:hypothetical protein